MCLTCDKKKLNKIGTYDWWAEILHRLGCIKHQKQHPWRLTWNLIMEVWKIIFLSKWVIYRFHVNLPGWNPLNNGKNQVGSWKDVFSPSTVCQPMVTFGVFFWMSRFITAMESTRSRNCGTKLVHSATACHGKKILFSEGYPSATIMNDYCGKTWYAKKKCCM